MKREKQHLIHDLLDGEGRSEEILVAGTKILRRRRQWRVTWRILAVILLASATGLLVEVGQQRPQLALNPPPQTESPKSPAPFQVQSLTDDQLLSLFTNTPVGLATLPNGKKLLIFPRPGDEAKFVTRL